ncbi:hypothetical protein EZS27_007188 [termite gut metagenome]|uniref:Uncharacterized protein n=1 Tax=termite gut metagenome TaxID=433724 RepID=A0A5J4SHG3_9ZZZZ
MPTLIEILDEVYTKLSLYETVDRNPIIKDFPKKEYSEVWRIETEVEVNSFQKGIRLFVVFDGHFPLSIPRIYLSQENYEEIKIYPTYR